jgi:hypothetical protein
MGNFGFLIFIVAQAHGQMLSMQKNFFLDRMDGLNLECKSLAGVRHVPSGSGYATDRPCPVSGGWEEVFMLLVRRRHM